MLIEPGTFSKSPRAWGLPADVRAVSGRGPYVKLSDGHFYLDTTSSLGQSLFGYDIRFLEYLCSKVLFGSAFTLAHEIEYKVADKLAAMLADHVPGWKNIGVRFGSAGSDVTSAAVRVARAYTGRMPILTFQSHYHGWHETFIGRTAPAYGCHIDQTIYQQPWGNPLNKYPDNYFAAIIFEHPSERPPRDFVRKLKQYCDQNNTLLIVDEVVTGFRYGLGGISKFYDFYPDLVCLGKALANGYRLSALAGDYEVMKLFTGDSPVFWSSTPSGNALELYACDWVLDHYGPHQVSELWRLGHKLIEGLYENDFSLYGHPVRFVFEWKNDLLEAAFIKEMFKRKILVNRPVMVNLAMTDADIDRFILEATRAKNYLLSQPEIAAGELPRKLFRGVKR